MSPSSLPASPTHAPPTRLKEPQPLPMRILIALLFTTALTLFGIALAPSTTRADDPPTPTVDPCSLPNVACTDGRVQDSFGD